MDLSLFVDAVGTEDGNEMEDFADVVGVEVEVVGVEGVFIISL